MKSKIISSESLVTKHKVQGVASISLLTYLFLYNLLPKEFWNTYISSNLPENLQTIGVSAVLSTLILLIFYHSDPLFKGNGHVSKWIRTLFASNLLIDKFDIDKHKANSLWFKYFNQWQHKEHPNHSFLRKNHAASYRARLIYFMIFLCFAYSAIGLLFYAISFLTFPDHAYLILASFYLLFGIILKILNYPPKFLNGVEVLPAKGVWHSVEGSFMETRNRFEAEVISKCASLTEAEEIVESSSQKWIK